MAKTLMNKVVALFMTDKQVKTASFLVASLRPVDGCEGGDNMEGCDFTYA